MTALRMPRPASVALVILCLWLIGSLGFTIMLRLTGPWLFPPTDDLGLLIMMLGGFYGARAASLFPALFIAAIVMAHSRFMRPYRVFASIVAGSGILALLLRWALRRPAWELISTRAVEVSFVLEVLLAATLVGVGVLFLYVYRRFCLDSHESITSG